MQYSPVFVVASMFLLLAAPGAHATTVLPAEFSEMVRSSPLIVHGTITSVRSGLSGPRRTIETLVTVDVIDAIKGGGARQIVFRTPNGQVGRYRRITVGAPEFSEGEEVVLFLAGRPPMVPLPFGLNQGVYRVNRSGGQAVVAAVISEAAGRVVRGDPARRPLTVDAFAREVRAAMERR